MKYCVHFIIKNQKVLLLKRKKSNPFFPNIWTPVIGKIRPHESPKNAVIRETKEETALEISTPSFIKQMTYDDNTYWFYRSSIKDAPIHLNHENDEHRFFDFKQLPSSLWTLFVEVLKKS